MDIEQAIERNNAGPDDEAGQLRHDAALIRLKARDIRKDADYEEDPSRYRDALAEAQRLDTEATLLESEADRLEAGDA